MDAVAKINEELLSIRRELDKYDAVKQFPKSFNPLTDALPAEVDQQFDRAIAAVKNKDEEALLQACHAIEAYFGFPAPDEQVKNAEIPGGMYTNMVAQLKQFNALEILPEAMKLIPSVRRDAGLPPLVTPTSQIVGAQAVNSALNQKNGRPKYANPSNQFVALVKGEYGKTPIPVDPEFRYQIAGTREEVEYDTSTYKRQDNPILRSTAVHSWPKMRRGTPDGALPRGGDRFPEKTSARGVGNATGEEGSGRDAAGIDRGGE